MAARWWNPRVRRQRDRSRRSREPSCQFVRRSNVVNGRLLDAQEVADWLGAPVSWVRESTRLGAMPCVPLGRNRRCDRDDVEAWL